MIRTVNTLAPGSFLFSLRNNDELLSFIAPLKDENDGNAIYRSHKFGPTFGKIYNQCRQNHKKILISRTSHGNTKAVSLLAGDFWFMPEEVEVLFLNKTNIKIIENMTSF